jgi:hypothetical protein
MNIGDLVAMGPGNDPFYSGQPAHIPAAEWFSRIWDLVGFRGRTSIHLRRFHYRIISDDRRYEPEWLIPNCFAAKEIQGKPFENTEECWKFLNEVSKHARHLGKVAESWDHYDAMGMMHQLGFILSPEETQA